MNTAAPQPLTDLYTQVCGAPPQQITALPRSGSDRAYWRLNGPGGSLLGAWNHDVRENEAFAELSVQLRSRGIRVPEVLAISADGAWWLVEDLGGTTLLDLVLRDAKEGRFPANLLHLYRETVAHLALAQVEGGKGWDYARSWPHRRFDRQTVLWDLQYFKYYFLRPCFFPASEEALERDFQALADRLMQSEVEVQAQGYFMFRDFQARNIMIRDGQPWFIDFQNGRNGPLAYDLASLLYQAKAALPPQVRADLLTHYLDTLSALTPVNREVFREEMEGFVLVRILQTLGAYGYRGWFERKAHFLESIPFAMHNLGELVQHSPWLEAYPALRSELLRLLASDVWKESPVPPATQPLTVTVQSFSYKKGLPADRSGHGGGFVFDCRALDNPGRYTPYKTLTGLDAPVKQFLETLPELGAFLEKTQGLVEASVRNYLERGFDHLQVSFGCTGGQHRSVYCAEAMAAFLRKKFPVEVQLSHRETASWPRKEEA